MLAAVEPTKIDWPKRPASKLKAATNGHRDFAINRKGRLTIREARTDEALAIVEFTSTVLRGKAHCSQSSFSSVEDVEQLMCSGKFLLAESEKQVIGCAYLAPRLEASRLELLAVTPSLQRAGIGSQLLEAAERLSSSMHCSFMHLRVSNLHWEAIRFCRRRGYVEFGLEPLSGSQPTSLHCHIVRMCKRLEKDRWAF